MSMVHDGGGPDQEARLKQLERTIGCSLPSEYTLFLSRHRQNETGPFRFVSSNPDYWGVESIFELGSGPKHLQADDVLGLVSDVIPLNTLPIATDEGGNLYLLDCQSGSVSWWDHEQSLSETPAQHVAADFNEFLNLLELE